MAYRTQNNIIVELEKLFKLYEAEVKERVKDGCLRRSTANTYLTHSGNFIDWCKGNFIPGVQKFKNKTKPY